MAPIIVLTTKSPKFGLFVALAELIVGSQGHLLNFSFYNFDLSLRMGIFLTVLPISLIKITWQKQWVIIGSFLQKNKIIPIFILILLLALANGYWRGNVFSNIYHDFNNWLFGLYLIPILAYWEKDDWSKIKTVFFAGISVVALKTLLFLFVYSHGLAVVPLFYKWGRDTLWGEFTVVNGNLFRIFSQAQIFCLIGFVIFFVEGFLAKVKTVKNIIWQTVFLSIALISLSRSFWLAGILTIGLVSIGYLFKNQTWKNKLLMILKNWTNLVISGIGAVILLLVVINFPLSGNFQLQGADLLTSRFQNEAAISSRWSQLPNLTAKIAENPFWGSGFGTTITYKSSDPRIKNVNNPEGTFTTYAFEWGFLDLLVKFGLFGVITFLTIFGQKFYFVVQKLKNKKEDLENLPFIDLTVAIIVLTLVHATTPYLNHPLGLGVVVLFVAYFNFDRESNLQIAHNR
ncbi:MAG: O-antigen ligase family protein [Patescibacteria group bacterium]